MFIGLTLLTGIFYPLLVTGIAYLTMKDISRGSLIQVNGKIVGSKFIAQKFENPKYFWGRPSAVDYNPLPSGGSNLGPTSQALKKIVSERRDHLEKQQGHLKKIPDELLFASGSGLDPHILPETARYQINRIIQARGWDEKIMKPLILKLIDNLTEKRPLGFLGQKIVNVLELNLALDNLSNK